MSGAPPSLSGSLSVEEAVLTHTHSMSRAERLALAQSIMEQNRQSVRNDEFRRCLGAWIRRARKERGVQQALLADAIGVSRPAVASLERGRQGCTLEQFVAMCSVLNQNPWESLEEVLNWPSPQQTGEQKGEGNGEP